MRIKVERPTKGRDGVKGWPVTDERYRPSIDTKTQQTARASRERQAPQDGVNVLREKVRRTREHEEWGQKQSCLVDLDLAIPALSGTLQSC